MDKIWPAKFLLRLMELEAGSAFVNASFVLDDIRQIKDADEICKMKEASRLNDMAVERLIPLVNQGMTEQDWQKNCRRFIWNWVQKDILLSQSVLMGQMRQIHII